MSNSHEDSTDINDFIARWKASGAAERANYQLFLTELCTLLQLPQPEPTQPDNSKNDYVFERSVTFQHGDGKATPNYIDLYKSGCFILEAKQGSDKVTTLPLFPEAATPFKKGAAIRDTPGWDKAMQAAKNQAERYAKALTVEEGWPPFLIVVDVGHSIELYSEFSCSGKTYLPFPDPRSHRIFIDDLARPETQELLRAVWIDPHGLDPAKRTAKVTREVADRLARLAKSLESDGHSAERIGNFLKRCLFTMFAEDIGLIPLNSFTAMLESLRGQADKYAPMAASLWQTMKDGGFSTVLREKLLRFNGGLFEDAEALPLSEEQLELLILAGKADWQDVEPAIFGTLLERALNPRERHNLGAHYTPREYVERLVLPTVVEPLRSDWDAALAAAVSLAGLGKVKEAIAELKSFHHKLCNIRILDPACGSGNFLYVTFEHLKRLEGEVLDALDGFGERQDLLGLAGVTVDPHQLLGIEVNPRAAAITEMVLWIGYLQWHYRTMGNVQPPEPVIKKFSNIEYRDAVLDWDAIEPVIDEEGKPVTRWDGVTTKEHPVTGEQVPDEAARVSMVKYIKPRPAEWPDADFVVGNPPFIGNKRMRESLGDGYCEALRTVMKTIPASADYVMYWWHKSAELLRHSKLHRFGFITTNSLTQEFNSRVLQYHLKNNNPLSLVFAIPDHPWIDTADGADVRISMTVAEAGDMAGVLLCGVHETKGEDGTHKVFLKKYTGKIFSNVTINVDVTAAKILSSNRKLSSRGVIPHGAGMVLTSEQRSKLESDAPIRPYRNGRDIAGIPRGVWVIDCYGMSSSSVQERFPMLFQWLLDRVKPDRDAHRDKDLREKWWLHRRNNEDMRKSLEGLNRYIITGQTAKHRHFTFLHESILPDDKLITIASDDAFFLGVLSSRIHVVFALAAGGHLGVGNDPIYNKSRCFEAFPFPEASESQKTSIRQLAEQLDAHRKRQQEQHPKLTMTNMYNVLEKLRSGDSLTDKERITHEQGLVSVLKQLHDELDAAVADAYGWSVDLTDEEILQRLVDLNHERVKEEEQGLIRWLRPEYQNPSGAGVETQDTLIESVPTAKKVVSKRPWPQSLSEQMQAITQALNEQSEAVTAKQLAGGFMRAREKKVAELLEALVAIGQVREVGVGYFII